MLRVLLDQNIPLAVAAWLRTYRAHWSVYHTSDVGLSRQTDRKIFEWAQKEQAIIITFDEDFTDVRFLSSGVHAGIIRLRVLPTTIEETQQAIERLLSEVSEDELMGALVIIDQSRIRIRPPKESP